MEENNELINNSAVEYTDDNIRHLVPVCILESWVTERMQKTVFMFF